LPAIHADVAGVVERVDGIAGSQNEIRRLALGGQRDGVGYLGLPVVAGAEVSDHKEPQSILLRTVCDEHSDVFLTSPAGVN
jgi:hypothetical protein